MGEDQFHGACEVKVKLEHRLTQAPLIRLLLHYSLPAIGAYFISELYNMVDTYYVGHAIGLTGVAALGCAFPIQRLVIAFSLMFAFASANQLAFQLGRGDRGEARHILFHASAINFVYLLPFSLIIFLFRDSLLPLLGAKGTIAAPAKEYIGIVIWGSLFLGLSNTWTRITLALGRIYISVFSMALGAILNIIFDILFVVHLHEGVRGAAYATLLSQILSAAFAAVVYHQSLRRNALRARARFSFQRIIQLSRAGLPSFIVESEDAIVIAALNSLIFRLADVIGVSVLTIATKIYMFFFVIILGFAYGMQTIVAFNQGAGQYCRVRQCFRISLGLSLLSILPLYALGLYATEDLLAFFVSDSELIQVGVPCFRHMLLVFPLLAFYYSTTMFLQALGAERWASFLSLLRQIAILIPLAAFAVFVLKPSLSDFFYVYPVTDLLAIVFAGLVLKSFYPNLERIGVSTHGPS
ncbi:MAG: MATE family efflux transporter [Eubacteriales bacterium]|nr:MATE family efflux transporter [Eubacteriales bacterium]